MILIAKKAGFPHAGGLAALLLLCACARAPDTGVAATGDDLLAPAIIPPAEVADPSERPSYEVAIATAAADRNREKERCVDMPKLERETCEAAADATFAAADADLDDLRGNQ
jgi:hypothetical protein